MILCVTPNPAVDRTLIVPGFQPFEVNRAASSLDAAGGKGVNVARAVRVLGGQSTCAGFLGGDSGRRVQRLAEEEALAGAWTWIEGDTRICTIIVEPASGRATVVNERGPTVTGDDWERLRVDVLAAAQTASGVCFSGSLPPGSPVDAYARLLTVLQQSNIPVWVDTSGAALQAALTVPNLAIKINHEEIGALLQTTITDAASAVNAVQYLRERGASTVVVTMGASGAVVAHDHGRWWAQPPAVQSVSNVGSGDSFLAGLVVALDQGATIADALGWAVAAGTANALSVGGGQFDKADFERILAATRVVAL